MLTRRSPCGELPMDASVRSGPSVILILSSSDYIYGQPRASGHRRMHLTNLAAVEVSPGASCVDFVVSAANRNAGSSRCSHVFA